VAVLDGDTKALGASGENGLAEPIMATHTGMTTDEFTKTVNDWLATLGEEVAALGPFSLVYDGKGALPAIAYTLKDPKRAGFSLYDLSDRVRMRGWQIASPMTFVAR
jgi:glutamate/tyrosine decarboxylase-like PLP-dependent enzyme